MLRVTIDLIDAGDPMESRVIGQMTVGQFGAGPGSLRHYRANIDGRHVEIRNHNREEGCWSLIAKLLKERFE